MYKNMCHSNSFGIFSKTERFLTAFALPERSLCHGPTPVVLVPVIMPTMLLRCGNHPPASVNCAGIVLVFCKAFKTHYFTRQPEIIVYGHSTIWVTALDRPPTTNFCFCLFYILSFYSVLSAFVSVFKITACLNDFSSIF